MEEESKKLLEIRRLVVNSHEVNKTLACVQKMEKHSFIRRYRCSFKKKTYI